MGANPARKISRLLSLFPSMLLLLHEVLVGINT